MSKAFLSTAGSSSPDEPHLMQLNKLSGFLMAAAEWISLALIAAVPLVFSSVTSQSLEGPKQAVLMAGVTVAALCWLGALLVERAVIARRTMANAVVILFTAAVAVSAFMSGAKYVSIVGDYGQEHQSLVTIFLLALLFFIIVNVHGKKAFVERALFLTAVAGGAASIYALFQFKGIYLIPFITNGAFNVIGSTVNLGLFAAICVVIAATHFIIDQTRRLGAVKRVIVGISGLASLLVLLVIDFWPLWTAVVAGLVAVTVYAIIRPHAIGRLTWLAVPMGALIVSVLFLFVNIPMPIAAPIEVFPTLRQSVDVARDTLAANPVFGTGAGTFAGDFSLHRSVNLNESPLWYVRFDRGVSGLTTIAATLGFAGLVTWLAIVVVGLWRSAAYLIASKKKDDYHWLLLLATTAAWLAAVAGLVVYGFSFALQFAFWILFACLIRLTSEEHVVIKYDQSPRSALTMIFLFVIMVVLALAGWFVTGTRLYADILFTRATSMDVTKDADKIVAALESAARANPQSDLIERNLSQAYLVQIQNALNDQKIDATVRGQKIQTLTSGAVKAALRATELSPLEVDAWSQLGLIYENIAQYVSNAPDEAIKAFARATELDPTSPVHRTEAGKTYLVLADRALADQNAAKDEASKAAAKKAMDDALAKAETEFNKALALKADYAPASFQLALVFDRRGDTKEAVKRLEAVREASPNDTGVAFQLAVLYYRNGQKDKARTELERTVALAPDFWNARWLLATVYDETGSTDLAVKQLQAIIDANPGNETVAKQLKSFEDKLAGIVTAPTEAPAVLPEDQQTQNQPTIKPLAPASKKK